MTTWLDSTAAQVASLQRFRGEVYDCATARADALFELGDAVLSAGSVPSLPHYSCAGVFRRSHSDDLPGAGQGPHRRGAAA